MSVRPTSATDTPLDVAVTLDPVISITTDATGGTLSIPITPTSGGAFASSDLTVSVLTNNSTGYTLLMSSSTANTSLEHTVDTTYTIPTTTHTTSAPGALAANTWGYSRWADGQSTTPSTFSRIPALASPDTLRTTTEVAGASDTKLTFGAVVSAAMASGSYANTVTFTATSNYVPEPIKCPVLVGKTYLQDIKTPAGPLYGKDRQRVVLKDRRNGQDYYVQNIVIDSATCLAWMETNLRYAGDGSYDSSWGYDDDRYATTTALAANTQNLNDNIRPLTLHSGTGYAGGSQANAFTTAYYIDLYARGSGTDALDTTNPTNNTTFLGYLYSWCSAMGGQDTACKNGGGQIDQTKTICPAGWRLPTGGINGNFWRLNWAINGGYTNTSVGLRDNFLAVYSGIYQSSLGANAYYWSSSAVSASNAYALFFNNTTSIYPGTNSVIKATGAAVRCVL